MIDYSGSCPESYKKGMILNAQKGPARLTASGKKLIGSFAEMESGGQLSPEHSRWLMGLPAAWDFCGATAMASLRRKPKHS